MADDEEARRQLDRVLTQFAGGVIYKHEAIDQIIALRPSPPPLAYEYRVDYTA
jgi:hypothetical protein